MEKVYRERRRRITNGLWNFKAQKNVRTLIETALAGTAAFSVE
jgi:hypothetical protein